jgi:hypothetical protein
VTHNPTSNSESGGTKTASIQLVVVVHILYYISLVSDSFDAYTLDNKC